jgi:hypothetical protein
VDSFERRLGEARTSDDYWQAMRDVSVKFGFPHVRMRMAGTVYEHEKDRANAGPCCVMRIPLFDGGYVNFEFPSQSSVRHAIAITSIVGILQRSILSSTQQSVSDQMEIRQVPQPATAPAAGRKGVPIGGDRIPAVARVKRGIKVARPS